MRRSVNVGSLTCLSVLCVLLEGVVSTASADSRTDYILDCMGCHGAVGAGVPEKVPDMRSSLVRLSVTPAGRRYLVEVPGVAQAPLSNVALARLLNWMIRNLSDPPSPNKLKTFTPAEVAVYRSTPLVEVAGIRQRLLATTAQRRIPSPLARRDREASAYAGTHDRFASSPDSAGHIRICNPFAARRCEVHSCIFWADPGPLRLPMRRHPDLDERRSGC